MKDDHATVYYRILAVLLFSACSLQLTAQPKTIVIDSAANTVMVRAGDYSGSSSYYRFFGKHNRESWYAPVNAPIWKLDTLAGGLKPYQAGGSRQTMSLRLRDDKGHEYVLRSIDKTYGKILKPVYQNTIVTGIVNDQVSAGHPYAAFTVPPMAEAVKIYHTNPRLGYVPSQAALDTFSDVFGGRLYMFEERPDENWEGAASLGNAKNIIGTEKMLKKLKEDNSYSIDQQMYVRARLFDMFVSDWSRHEDQWRWAEFKDGKKTVFKPIPRDRDQVYSNFDGLLTGILLSLADLDNLQTFEKDIKDIKMYNFAARHLDRRCANETTLEDWTGIAKDMQGQLTDKVIEDAVRQLPPEVYTISGNDIVSKLKSRRDKLPEYAEDYYRHIARHVDVPGTEEREYFEVKRLSDEETSVQVYDMNKRGEKDEKPFYTRTFKTNETKDIRLYGISGHDLFRVEGKVDDGIKLRVVGGPEADTMIDESNVSDGCCKTKFYDDHDNVFITSKETQLKLKDDSAVHAYNYEEFEPHRKGIKTSIYYHTPDKFYVSLGYKFSRHMWRKYPYGFEHYLSVRYSITQNAFSLYYTGILYQAVGKWNLTLSANQDFLRWTNFFGLGNETERITEDRNFYRLRTDEFLGKVGLNRVFASKHYVDVEALFNAVEIKKDLERYVGQNYAPGDLYFYEHRKYAGANISYTYQKVDDRVLPVKGIMASATATFLQNIENADRQVFRYDGIFHLFLPLIDKFSLSSRVGATVVDGTPEFFQYASIGGSQKMRGHLRDRYWGQTAFYNTNELRWITDFHTRIVAGKIGLVALMDNGRVWMPGEESDKWHIGYGGGFLFSPYKIATFSVTYAVSEDDQRFHIGVVRLLRK